MRIFKSTCAALGAAALLFPTLAFGQAGQLGQPGQLGEGQQLQLTEADFEQCSRQAMMIAGITPDPAASPRPDAPAAAPGLETPGVTTPGVGETQPGVTGTTPGIGETQPGVGETQPGVTGTPGIGETQPGVGETQPGVTGTPGVGETQPGMATPGVEDTELDRVVEAFRSCLQQRM
jgi:hypothetical protein